MQLQIYALYNCMGHKSLMQSGTININIMIGYILYNYVASDNTWCEFKRSCSLKSLKNYVIAERSENKLLMPLRIYSETTGKIVKKYKKIIPECINK